jgi:hypothetical protein
MVFWCILESSDEIFLQLQPDSGRSFRMMDELFYRDENERI